MKISLITVTYNAQAFLEHSLQSVMAQDYGDVEYIVIDGRSTDNTLQIINHYRDSVDILVSEPDNGMYDALNKGISLATGDVVGVLHADDYFAGPQVISRIADTFKASAADIVYGNLDYVHPQNSDKVVRKWRSKPYSKGMFDWGWMPAHPTFYARRDLFTRYGAYKPGFGSAADYELMLRFIHKHEACTVFLPEVIVKMRTGGMSNSSVKNRVSANKADLEAMRINGIRFPRITALLKPLRKLPQFFRV
ncbi:glycosyltransferase (plasmid) [Pedobacter sp. BS3]|uniref:glycosyltransferase family 2 protein n=1 Tax=Pedobacter sp. BS3 TaxID=2567937 RepID=UPI0011EF19E8|nr:glycosyltransferase family 2 protein [Pedobacter sp. BS3]TZF86416.1 glycosyltransferase [Pedobacter sp. BS3]